MSPTGQRTFLQKYDLAERKEENFLILVWNHGQHLARRFLRQFGTSVIDPFGPQCPVHNCRVTRYFLYVLRQLYKRLRECSFSNDSELSDADLVLFHLHRTKTRADLPKKRGKSNQIWTFLTDESPYNTFLYRQSVIFEYNNLFNWSMAYRYAF